MPGKPPPAAIAGEARGRTQPGYRVFKAAKFVLEARKRGISENELCAAINQVQASPKSYSLGGGVYKKRLNNNLDRSIILAKGGKNWFYVHLFRKSDRDNISKKELAQFKAAADVVGKLSDADLDRVVAAGELEEICLGFGGEKGN